MDMWLYFYLLMLLNKVTESMQDKSQANNIPALIDKFIEETEDKGEESKNEIITEISKSGASRNSSKIIYLKTVTKPRIIYKRKPYNVETKKKSEVSQFQYDDLDDVGKETVELFSEKRNESRSINIEQESIDDKSIQTMEKESGEVLGSESLTRRGEGDIYPDLVIDQVVYEESDTKVDSLKKTMQELDQKLASRDEKDKQNFVLLLSEIGQLYTEIQELKRTQKQLNKNIKMPTGGNDLTDSEVTHQLQPLPLYQNPSAIAYPVPHYRKAVLNYSPPRLVTTLRPFIIQPARHLIQTVVPKQNIILPQLQISTGIRNTNQRLVHFLPMVYQRVH